MPKYHKLYFYLAAAIMAALYFLIPSTGTAEIVSVIFICCTGYIHGPRTSMIFAFMFSTSLYLSRLAHLSGASADLHYTVSRLLLFTAAAAASGFIYEYKKRYYILRDKELLQITNSLIHTIDAKSPLTCMHSETVTKYALKIAEALDLSSGETRKLKYACLLHDIGKIAVPDNILDKPEKLTDDEFSVIRSHPERGCDIIESIGDLTDISNIILHHHERFDGTGYPNKLSGSDIPLLSRIISVADSFDAMTSSRPYKVPLTLDKAVTELKKCSGSQFDSEIVNTFISLLENDIEIFNVYAKRLSA